MVYEIVKKLCKERNLSIRRLEIISGLGNGTIGGWKKSAPRIDKLTAVAKALQVPVEILLR